MHPGPLPPATDSLAIACGPFARIWRPISAETSEPVSLLHNGTCTSLRYNHNNKVLASATDEGRFRLHYHTGSLMGELPADGGGMGPINSIAFSRGSKLLAAGCSTAEVHLWDLKSQVLALVSWLQHTISVAVSPLHTLPCNSTERLCSNNCLTMGPRCRRGAILSQTTVNRL